MYKAVKKALVTALVLFLTLINVSAVIRAETQSEELCYSQCAAYRFVWQGDYCWDLFQSQCSSGSGKSFQDTIKFLKSVHSTIQSGKNVDTVFKAWFVCKPLIENCIAPQLEECRQTCEVDQYYFAPDLSVGHPDSRYHGAVYSEQDGLIYFKLVNNGRGYSWDIDIEAVSGHTANRDGIVQTTQQLFKEKVEHLIYLGARNGPPKTVSDYVTDFLIEESNFSSWLQGFKSDANDYNVPNYWMKTVPFQPVAGELNRVIFKVDADNIIPEANERNNTFILDIDLRPTPARFSIEDLSYQLQEQTLNNFLLQFELHNHGEATGNATIQFFEGKYQTGMTPFFESTHTVNGESDIPIETNISIDIAKENNPYCGKRKEYTIVVIDENTNKIQRTFSLPIYLETVSGRVEDLFGKKIVGAKIKASTGQETTTSQTGYYQLGGITTLGRVTLSASHPEYSQNESTTVLFTYGNEFEACHEGKLLINGINFILKDQAVLFNVILKDTAGNPVTGHVLAANDLFRTEADISGNGPLSELQPGQYHFTISASGYKTLGQDVNAVPNNLTLEFILSPLNGRQDDSSLVITSPQLLWELDRGTEIFQDARTTKDGKTVILYTSKNKPNTGKLYFIDSISGTRIASINTIANQGNSQASIDASYDGNTVALCSNEGSTSGKNRDNNWLKLFNAQGESLGEISYEGKLSTHRCEVSPDGFYLNAFGLLNKGLHVYTDFEILGQKDDESTMSYGSYKGSIFTPANQILAGCPSDTGICLQTLSRHIIHNLGEIEGVMVFSDSSQDSNKLVTITNKKAYSFVNGNKQWEENVETRANSLSVGISPGGEYVIFSSCSPTTQRTVRVLNQQQDNLTPEGVPANTNSDVAYVSANDLGLFYLLQDGKKLAYYQIGHYTDPYLPDTIQPSPSEQRTSGLSYLGWANRFYPAGEQTFASLDIGTIYKADRKISLDIKMPFSSTSLGTLTIAKDTLFSINNHHQPVLLKGQLTANFGSPAIIYAIKFDRNDLGDFKLKLTDFIHNLLPEDEYFVVKNIHTLFTIKNELDLQQVTVVEGEVEVSLSQNTTELKAGKQLVISTNNQFLESRYLALKYQLIMLCLLLAVLAVGLYWGRKSWLGSRVLKYLLICSRLLKKGGIFLLKYGYKITKIIFKHLYLGFSAFFKWLIQLINNHQKE